MPSCGAKKVANGNVNISRAPIAHLGRFILPGRHGARPWGSRTFNRCGYWANNPVIYRDPSGELFGIDDTTAGWVFRLFMDFLLGSTASVMSGEMRYSAQE